MQNEFESMGDAAAQVDTYQMTPENLRLMAEAQREQGGLLNFAQAAILLRVTHTRVRQLVANGQLRRFTFCGSHYVSYPEVTARLHAEVKTGRPKEPLSRRMKASVKAALLTDKAQMANGGFRGPCFSKK